MSRAEIEALGGRVNGQHLEAILVTLEPGGSSGTRAFPSPCEEFGLVQEGSVVLTLGEGEQTLGPGDAVSILPGTARILIVSAR